MTREEAIKIIDCYDINFYDLSGEKIPAYKLAEAFDMAIEALSAEAVQGEWIDRSEGGRVLNPWWESHKCDQCGYCGSGAWNFCPNCGARMGGGAE